jgi:ankyrin repeat protein
MKPLSKFHNAVLLIGLLIPLTFIGCKDMSPQASPDQAKRLVKLRGYNFDEKSFLAAAAASDEVAVNAFLVAGMNPNVKDEATGGSALITAATRGDLEMVQALVAGRADVNQIDEKGFTALLRALQNRRDDVADLLVTQPALSVNAQTPGSSTALISYVARDNERSVESLLSRGADPNLQDSDGDAALHIAVQRGRAPIINMLLAKGANPNLKNKLGGTPLMWAGVFGNRVVAQTLLDKGADPALKDVDGLTAADWAQKNNHPQVADFLREAEKNRSPKPN